MKAWNDLQKDRKMYLTRDSEYYIDMGVKIERFDKDGRIEIKNTMTSSEQFEHITFDQFMIFNDVGWTQGCITVNIDVLKKKIELQEYLATTEAIDKEAIIRRIEKNNIKLLEYQQMLVNFDIQINKPNIATIY
jgi:hypothetical protein